MDALKIALETMIVGALALPWLFLLVDLFCPEKEHLFKQLLELLDSKAVATWPVQSRSHWLIWLELRWGA